MEQEIEIAEERHVFRTLFKFAVFAGLLYLAAKFLNDKKNEYGDLTESEARSKFVEMAGPRVGDDTAEEIADQVIPKLKDRGLIKADPAEEVDEAADEAADEVTEAVDSVAKE